MPQKLEPSRITEQIDALEIMGVNSANYLILPKIVAFVLMIPFLTIFSMAIGLIGGYFVALFSDIITVAEYVTGIQYAFNAYYVFYSIVKSLVLLFLFLLFLLTMAIMLMAEHWTLEKQALQP